eukprot:Polyplicarium_translucidae@DN2061_c0_g1_i1.p1
MWRTVGYYTSEALLRAIIYASCVGIEWVRPLVRGVPLSWEDYSKPRKDETYNDGLLMGLCVVAFLVAVGFGLIYNSVKERRTTTLWRDFVVALLAFTLAFFLSLLLTQVIKVMVGQLRPDFLARCFDSDEPQDWPDPVPESPECEDRRAENSGRKSFPSGHASMSWSAYTFAALYVYRYLIREPLVGSWALAAPCCFLIVPTLISASRVTDNLHHPRDVIAGALLGFGVSALVFYWYYAPRKATEERSARRSPSYREVPWACGCDCCALSDRSETVEIFDLPSKAEAAEEDYE